MQAMQNIINAKQIQCLHTMTKAPGSGRARMVSSHLTIKHKLCKYYQGMGAISCNNLFWLSFFLPFTICSDGTMRLLLLGSATRHARWQEKRLKMKLTFTKYSFRIGFMRQVACQSVTSLFIKLLHISTYICKL